MYGIFLGLGLLGFTTSLAMEAVELVDINTEKKVQRGILLQENASLSSEQIKILSEIRASLLDNPPFDKFWADRVKEQKIFFVNGRIAPELFKKGYLEAIDEFLPWGKIKDGAMHEKADIKSCFIFHNGFYIAKPKHAEERLFSVLSELQIKDYNMQVQYSLGIIQFLSLCDRFMFSSYVDEKDVGNNKTQKYIEPGLSQETLQYFRKNIGKTAIYLLVVSIDQLGKTRNFLKQKMEPWHHYKTITQPSMKCADESNG